MKFLLKGFLLKIIWVLLPLIIFILYAGDTRKGDSYMGETIRIKIHGNTNGNLKYVQVILKSIPDNMCRRLTYNIEDFFKNEINFYQKVVPKLLQFQSSKNIMDPFTSFAKVFLAYTDGCNDVLCLEDASVDRFEIHPSRQKGLDYEHSKITLGTLAQMHAMSFAIRDQDPETFNRMSDAIFDTYFDPRLKDWYARFWSRLCEVAIEAVETEFPKTVYMEKVKQFAVPETYERMIRAARDKTNAVMCHGDSWTSNFLYKYVDGRPVAAKIIDFQFTRCASPVLDITFFIYACTEQELRGKYYDELLKYYYEKLSERIKDLGSDPNKVYSWVTFMYEVRNYSYFGLAMSFESTPYIVLAPEDAVDMEIEGDKKMNMVDFCPVPSFKTKEGRLREANNIKHCVDNGYI